MSRCLRVVPALAVTALVLAGAVTANVSRRVPPHERLHIASMVPGDTERQVVEALDRIESLCRTDAGCNSRSVKVAPIRVAPFYAARSLEARRVGVLLAVVSWDPSESGRAQLSLDIERSEDGRTARWIEDGAAWDYGISVPGVRTRGEWVQFPQLPLVGDAWMPTRSSGWIVAAEPLEGQVVTMTPMAADLPNGRTVTTAAGDYLVTGVWHDRVHLRLEVESDYACGQGIPPPRVMPPTLSASPANLFEPSGAPRFQTKYTKGC